MFDRRYWIYVTGPLFGLVVYFCVAIVGFKPSNDLGALIAALIAYVVGRDIAAIIEIKQNEEYIDRAVNSVIKNSSQISDHFENRFILFEEDLKSRLKVSRIDSPKILDAVAASIRQSYKVKNTYVSLKDMTGAGSFRATRIVDIYLSMLDKSRDTIWEDIVGIEEIFDGRYEAIYNEKLKRNLDENFGSHEVSIFHSNNPIVNFILCGSQDGEYKEVYFGWIRDKANSLDVFHTKDDRLVKLFNNYFDLLKSSKDRLAKVTIDYNPDKRGLSINSIVHRLCGKWIGADGSVTSIRDNNPSKANSDLTEFSIITISYEEKWTVNIKVYDFQRFELIYAIESDGCMMIENDLYYKFIVRDAYGSEDSRGIGIYSINMGVDLLAGYYVKNNTNSHKIKALKISRDAKMERDIIVAHLRTLINGG